MKKKSIAVSSPSLPFAVPEPRPILHRSLRDGSVVGDWFGVNVCSGYLCRSVKARDPDSVSNGRIREQWSAPERRNGFFTLWFPLRGRASGAKIGASSGLQTTDFWAI